MKFGILDEEDDKPLYSSKEEITPTTELYEVTVQDMDLISPEAKNLFANYGTQVKLGDAINTMIQMEKLKQAQMQTQMMSAYMAMGLNPLGGDNIPLSNGLSVQNPGLMFENPFMPEIAQEIQQDVARGALVPVSYSKNKIVYERVVDASQEHALRPLTSELKQSAELQQKVMSSIFGQAKLMSEYGLGDTNSISEAKDILDAYNEITVNYQKKQLEGQIKQLEEVKEKTEKKYGKDNVTVKQIEGQIENAKQFINNIDTYKQTITSNAAGFANKAYEMGEAYKQYQILNENGQKGISLFRDTDYVVDETLYLSNRGKYLKTLTADYFNKNEGRYAEMLGGDRQQVATLFSLLFKMVEADEVNSNIRGLSEEEKSFYSNPKNQAIISMMMSDYDLVKSKANALAVQNSMVEAKTGISHLFDDRKVQVRKDPLTGFVHLVLPTSQEWIRGKQYTKDAYFIPTGVVPSEVNYISGFQEKTESSVKALGKGFYNSLIGTLQLGAFGASTLIDAPASTFGLGMPTAKAISYLDNFKAGYSEAGDKEIVSLSLEDGASFHLNWENGLATLGSLIGDLIGGGLATKGVKFGMEQLAKPFAAKIATSKGAEMAYNKLTKWATKEYNMFSGIPGVNRLPVGRYTIPQVVGFGMLEGKEVYKEGYQKDVNPYINLATAWLAVPVTGLLENAINVEGKLLGIKSLGFSVIEKAGKEGESIFARTVTNMIGRDLNKMSQAVSKGYQGKISSYLDGDNLVYFNKAKVAKETVYKSTDAKDEVAEKMYKKLSGKQNANENISEMSGNKEFILDSDGNLRVKEFEITDKYGLSEGEYVEIVKNYKKTLPARVGVWAKEFVKEPLEMGAEGLTEILQSLSVNLLKNGGNVLNDLASGNQISSIEERLKIYDIKQGYDTEYSAKDAANEFFIGMAFAGLMKGANRLRYGSEEKQYKSRQKKYTEMIASRYGIDASTKEGQEELETRYQQQFTYSALVHSGMQDAFLYNMKKAQRDGLVTEQEYKQAEGYIRAYEKNWRLYGDTFNQTFSGVLGKTDDNGNPLIKNKIAIDIAKVKYIQDMLIMEQMMAKLNNMADVAQLAALQKEINNENALFLQNSESQKASALEIMEKIYSDEIGKLQNEENKVSAHINTVIDAGISTLFNTIQRQQPQQGSTDIKSLTEPIDKSHFPKDDDGNVIEIEDPVLLAEYLMYNKDDYDKDDVISRLEVVDFGDFSTDFLVPVPVSAEAIAKANEKNNKGEKDVNNIEKILSDARQSLKKLKEISAELEKLNSTQGFDIRAIFQKAYDLSPQTLEEYASKIGLFATIAKDVLEASKADIEKLNQIKKDIAIKKNAYETAYNNKQFEGMQKSTIVQNKITEYEEIKEQFNKIASAMFETEQEQNGVVKTDELGLVKLKGSPYRYKSILEFIKDIDEALEASKIDELKNMQKVSGKSATEEYKEAFNAGTKKFLTYYYKQLAISVFSKRLMQNEVDVEAEIKRDTNINNPFYRNYVAETQKLVDKRDAIRQEILIWLQSDIKKEKENLIQLLNAAPKSIFTEISFDLTSDEDGLITGIYKYLSVFKSGYENPIHVSYYEDLLKASKVAYAKEQALEIIKGLDETTLLNLYFGAVPSLNEAVRKTYSEFLEQMTSDKGYFSDDSFLIGFYHAEIANRITEKFKKDFLSGNIKLDQDITSFIKKKIDNSNSLRIIYTMSSEGDMSEFISVVNAMNMKNASGVYTEDAMSSVNVSDAEGAIAKTEEWLNLLNSKADDSYTKEIQKLTALRDELSELKENISNVTLRKNNQSILETRKNIEEAIDAIIQFDKDSGNASSIDSATKNNLLSLLSNYYRESSLPDKRNEYDPDVIYEFMQEFEKALGITGYLETEYDYIESQKGNNNFVPFTVSQRVNAMVTYAMLLRGQQSPNTTTSVLPNHILVTGEGGTGKTTSIRLGLEIYAAKHHQGNPLKIAFICPTLELLENPSFGQLSDNIEITKYHLSRETVKAGQQSDLDALMKKTNADIFLFDEYPSYGEMGTAKIKNAISAAGKPSIFIGDLLQVSEAGTNVPNRLIGLPRSSTIWRNENYGLYKAIETVKNHYINTLSSDANPEYKNSDGTRNGKKMIDRLKSNLYFGKDTDNDDAGVKVMEDADFLEKIKTLTAEDIVIAFDETRKNELISKNVPKDKIYLPEEYIGLSSKNVYIYTGGVTVSDAMNSQEFDRLSKNFYTAITRAKKMAVISNTNNLLDGYMNGYMDMDEANKGVKNIGKEENAKLIDKEFSKRKANFPAQRTPSSFSYGGSNASLKIWQLKKDNTINETSGKTGGTGSTQKSTQTSPSVQSKTSTVVASTADELIAYLNQKIEIDVDLSLYDNTPPSIYC